MSKQATEVKKALNEFWTELNKDPKNKRKFVKRRQLQVIQNTPLDKVLTKRKLIKKGLDLEGYKEPEKKVWWLSIRELIKIANLWHTKKLNSKNILFHRKNVNTKTNSKFFLFLQNHKNLDDVVFLLWCGFVSKNPKKLRKYRQELEKIYKEKENQKYE